ncbi:hypothetical protein K1719_021611 [Acacia pycnantha]|nr:hypothetical protein K1719_021611 [Acacia pycnantha]
MGDRERERSRERGGGKDGKECLGGADDDGDGGRRNGKGSASVGGKEFAFGHNQESKGSGSASLHGTSPSARPGAPKLSYRDKLLSPGCAGFLVQHSETDDIVKGWKSYFRQMNAKEDHEEPDESEEVEDTMAERGEGKPGMLKFTADEYAAWCLPWTNSLIIKVLGAHFPLYVIRDRINRMWRPKNPLKLIPLSNGYYIVSFSNKEDKEYAFQEGPWMIEDHYLIVQRWRPNFNPWNADLQCNIAAWIRLPDVPFEFYNVESLRRIGNMVGKMIKLDRSTSVYDKGGFARICVEIDLKKPLLPSYKIFNEERPIVYEGLHQVCFRCGKYGHKKESCLVKQEEDQGKKEGVKEDASMETPEVGGVSRQQTPPEVETSVPPNTSGNVARDEYRFGKIKILKRDFRGDHNAAKSKGELNDNGKAKMGQQLPGEQSDSRRMKSRQEIGVTINDRKGDVASNSPAKSEWVQVGVKRKNVGKGKLKGKENRPPSQPRGRKLTQVGRGMEPSHLNPFGVLQTQDARVDVNPDKEGNGDRTLNNLGLNGEGNIVAPPMHERPTEPIGASMGLMGPVDQILERDMVHFDHGDATMGTGTRSFTSLIRDMRTHYHLDFIAILETRCTPALSVGRAKSLGFPNMELVDCEGYSGGIWCLWDHSISSVSVLERHHQFLHLKITSSARCTWTMTIVYASPSCGPRRVLWDHLSRLAPSIQGAWLVGGDLNGTLLFGERRSAAKFQTPPDRDFQRSLHGASRND